MPKWNSEPWAQSPNVLLEDLEIKYRLAMHLGKVETPAKTTCKKLMAAREWCDSVPQDTLLQAVEDLEAIYVLKDVPPGPGILFPIRDVTGEIRRVHIRVNDPKVYGSRYLSITDTDNFIGPPWLGMDDATLLAIIQTHTVIVMEGPFDLLAIRTLEPKLPAVSSLTKKLGEGHWDYLKILGVKRIYVMFDNEAQGKLAASAMQERHKDFEITSVLCPAHDPSDAMKTPQKLSALRRILHTLVPIPKPLKATPTFILEDD